MFLGHFAIFIQVSYLDEMRFDLLGGVALALEPRGRFFDLL